MVKRGKGCSRVPLNMWGVSVGDIKEGPGYEWMKEKTFCLVETLDELKTVIDQAIQSDYVSLDTETFGLDNRVYIDENGRRTIRDKMVGFSLCYEVSTGYYVPLRHDPPQEDFNRRNVNLPLDDAMQELQRLLTHAKKLVFHSGEFDRETLYGENLDLVESVDRISDTQKLSFIDDSNQHVGLKDVSARVLGMKMISINELFAEGADIQFDRLDPEEAFVYGSSDAICTFHLYEYFMSSKRVKEQPLIHKMEIALIDVLRRMSRNRCRIDVDHLIKVQGEVQAFLDRLTSEIREECRSPDLNIESPKELGEVLFQKMGIPSPGKTANGQHQTNHETLEAIDKKTQGKFPVLGKIIEFRKDQKLLNTYLSNLITSVDMYGDTRFGFRSCGAPTGRMAGSGGEISQGFSGVNPQAIPKVSKGKPNIRKGVIAREGFVIAAIDFAAVELRIAGNLSREPAWIREFSHANCQALYGASWKVENRSVLDKTCPFCRMDMGDVHTQTAENVWGSSDKEKRGKAKAINFGILYGAGPKTISENAKIPLDEAREAINKFFLKLPNLKKWIDNQKRLAASEKKVKTAYGRLRLLPQMDSPEQGIIAFGERTAINSPVQGSSADITKLAMIKCDILIRRMGWENDCKMLLSVHDEIVFEVRESMADTILPALGETMVSCGISSWPIPLCVDIECGPSWGEVDPEIYPGIAYVWLPPPPTYIPLVEDPIPLPFDPDAQTSAYWAYRESRKSANLNLNSNKEIIWTLQSNIGMPKIRRIVSSLKMVSRGETDLLVKSAHGMKLVEMKVDRTDFYLKMMREFGADDDTETGFAEDV